MFKELLEATQHLPEKNALLKTTYLNQVSHVETRETIKSSYKHSDLNIKLMGTIFNAIVTENKSTFWLSRSILEALLAQDKHASRATLSGTTYKDFMDYVTTNNLLEQRRLGGTFKGKKVPSVFRLKDSHLLGMFDACCAHNWRKFIDDAACEKWDSLYISTTKDQASPSKSPEKEKEKEKEKEREKLAELSIKEEIQEVIDSVPHYKEWFTGLPKEDHTAIQSMPTVEEAIALLKTKIDNRSPKFDLSSIDEDLFPDALESAPVMINSPAPVSTPKLCQPSIEAILRQWRKSYDNNLDFLKSKVLDANLGDLLATIKEHGYEESDISKSAILKTCFGANPSPKLKAWKDEVSAAIDGCIIDTFQAPVTMAAAAEPRENVKLVSSEAQAKYRELIAQGKTTADFNGMSVAEYANQRAHAESFPVMSSAELEERMRKFDKMQKA